MKKFLLLLIAAGIFTKAESLYKGLLEKKGRPGVEMYITQSDSQTKNTTTQHIKTRSSIDQTINLNNDTSLVIDLHRDLDYDVLILNGSIMHHQQRSPFSFNAQVKDPQPWHSDWSILEFTYENSTIRLAYRKAKISYSNNLLMEKYLHDQINNIELLIPKNGSEFTYGNGGQITRPLSADQLAHDQVRINAKKSDTNIKAHFLLLTEKELQNSKDPLSAPFRKIARINVIDPDKKMSNLRFSLSMNNDMSNETTETKLSIE